MDAVSLMQRSMVGHSEATSVFYGEPCEQQGEEVGGEAAVHLMDDCDTCQHHVPGQTGRHRMKGNVHCKIHSVCRCSFVLCAFYSTPSGRCRRNSCMVVCIYTYIV